MRKMNNKGFTLIELLAVIVILGILMIIAIPMVSQYIREAKQNAFVATAKAYVSSARYEYMNGDYDCGTTDIDSGSGGKIYISFNDIEVDKTGGNSSFNKKIDKDTSFVMIEANDKGEYTYYVAMRDFGKNGIDVPTNEDYLTKKFVKNTVTAASYAMSEGLQFRYDAGNTKTFTSTDLPTLCSKIG